MVTKDDVTKALKQVIDPEIRIDVWTLGLVYDTSILGNNVKILMTLTSPMCPYGPQLIEDVKTNIKNIAKAKEVLVEITFNPPWKPSEDVKMMLGIQ
ncbi:metal-sulfur cluster assembly factor [Candidatus Woesearchaeota archaeon]|nr:metal-sulfur cluster assembly factor [Candidatus Woesearchaeota archaeon]